MCEGTAPIKGRSHTNQLRKTPKSRKSGRGGGRGTSSCVVRPADTDGAGCRSTGSSGGAANSAPASTWIRGRTGACSCSGAGDAPQQHAGAAHWGSTGSSSSVGAGAMGWQHAITADDMNSVAWGAGEQRSAWPCAQRACAHRPLGKTSSSRAMKFRLRATMTLKG